MHLSEHTWKDIIKKKKNNKIKKKKKYNIKKKKINKK